jgi:hypothetical protein
LIFLRRCASPSGRATLAEKFMLGLDRVKGASPAVRDRVDAWARFVTELDICVCRDQTGGRVWRHKWFRLSDQG